MAGTSDTYRLVVFDDNVDPHIVRDAIVEELKMHPTDAMRFAAHAPGVVPLKLSRDQVDELLIYLGAEDVDAEGWPISRLPDLSSPRLVHKVGVSNDGIQVIGTRGETVHWLPWEHVELLSVGVIPQEPRLSRIVSPVWVQAATTAARLPLMMTPSKTGSRKRVVEEQPVAELWLVRNRPVHALRIQQNKMNYEYLGSRLKSATNANFRLLLDDILKNSKSAEVTRSMKSYLVYERPGVHFFSSAQTLMDYTSLQLLRLWRAHQAESDE